MITVPDAWTGSKVIRQLMSEWRHVHDPFAEEATVLALQGLGRVPVEDGDVRLHPCNVLFTLLKMIYIVDYGFYYKVRICVTKGNNSYSLIGCLWI